MKINRFSLRTKAEVMIVAFILIGISALSVMSVTRTITDENDTVYTRITNSNGGVWEATGANIQVAIDNIGTGNGTVTLPAGSLEINEELFINNSNIKIKGAGVNLTRIFSDKATGGDATTFATFELDDVNNVTLEGFTIDMNNKGGNAIWIHNGCEYINIYDLSIYNSGFQAIYTNGARYMDISGVHVRHGASTGGHGFGLNQLNDSTIDNCILENYHYDATEDGIDYHGCVNVTSNNIVIKGRGWHDGVKITNNDGFPSAEDLTLSNFVISNPNNNGMRIQTCQYINLDNINIVNPGAMGIRMYSTANRTNLNNVFISESGDDGLNIAGENITCSKVHVSNAGDYGLYVDAADNVSFVLCRFNNSADENRVHTSQYISFDNCRFYANEDGTYAGITFFDSNHFFVSNCFVVNNAFRGIGIYQISVPCHNFSIHDNTIKNNGNDGIFISAHAHDFYIIKDNILGNNGGDEIQDDGTGETKIIKDNVGYDNSTYNYISCGTETSIYASPFDGAMMFVEGNRTLAVYHGSRWYYYDNEDV